MVYCTNCKLWCEGKCTGAIMAMELEECEKYVADEEAWS